MLNHTKDWEDAGYPKEMGSASFLPAPPSGFIRVYYFTSAKYGLSSIKNRHLKVARFSDANDPFELLGLGLRDGETRTIVKDFKKGIDRDTGILCFTPNWTNPIMWSHYAEKHAGVCLGFDLKEESVHKVYYQEDRLMAKLDGNQEPFVIDEELKGRLLLTKSHHWKYEDERRLFIPLTNVTKDGELYFRSFDEGMRLAEVILGPRCRKQIEKFRDETRKTSPCAIVFRSRMAFGEFKVILNGWDSKRITDALTARPKNCL
jgi:hypothetical protein